MRTAGLFAVALLVTQIAFSAEDHVFPGADEPYAPARIENLRTKYREILTASSILPESDYGPNAVSCGSSATRFITLHNPTLQKRKCRVWLNQSIGLAKSDYVELRRLYPTERVIGLFRYNPGYHITVFVEPARSALLMATTKPAYEISVFGCDYQVVQDAPGKPVILNLLGRPGRREIVTISAKNRSFKSATLNGKSAPDLAAGKPAYVSFPGEPNELPTHRELGQLKPVDVPADAQTLFEPASSSKRSADPCALEARFQQGRKAYQLSATITEAAPNSYIAVPIAQDCNPESLLAAVRVDGKLRAVMCKALFFLPGLCDPAAGPANPPHAFYLPVTDDMLGKKIDVVVLPLKDAPDTGIRLKCYITAYPHPYIAKTLTLE